MKKFYLTFLIFAAIGISTAFSAEYTISISGLTYSPADLDANVGDTITIEATGNHPTAQVSQATWDANGTTPLGSGFGVQTSSFTFEITSTDDIYYVCQNHVGAGMKGKINVSVTTGVNEDSAINLSIYPNPSFGDFTIQGDKEMLKDSKLMLYNISGQLAHSFPITGEKVKLEQEVAPGVYTGIIEKNDEILLRKRLVFLRK